MDLCPPPMPFGNPVHKALRRFMFETLVRTGSLDLTQRTEIERTLNLVQRLLDLLRTPAPALARTMRALLWAGASERPVLAAVLYRELAALVTAQLLRLQASDADREPLAGERLALLDADELQDLLVWMAGAVSPQELSDLLDELRANVEPALYRQGLDALTRPPGRDRRRPAAGDRTLPYAARAAETGSRPPARSACAAAPG